MSFAEYHRYGAMGLADLVSRGEVRPSEVVGEAIDTIERHNPNLNAVIHKMYDGGQAGRVARFLPAHHWGSFLLKDLGPAFLAFRIRPCST